MKKILLVALMALCGASFSFGGSIADCVDDCLEVKQNRSESECVGDCATKATVKARPEYVIPELKPDIILKTQP